MAQPRKLHDKFFKQAKAEGYAARSAYKLKDIDQKKRLIRRGDRVLDLGCAPGSWLQVAAELVGDRGLVIGLDLKPVELSLPRNVIAIVGDVFKAQAPDLLGQSATHFDVVLSDMAPNTEGGAGGTTDHFRSVHLCERILDLLPQILRPGGHLAMKVFEGEAYPDLLKRSARLFAEAKGFKPEASRDVSREMYIVAKGYKGDSNLKPAPTDGAVSP